VTVLVTGATGTIGRWCVRELRGAGLDVVAVGGPRRPDGVDLLDRTAVEALVSTVRPEGIVHLAWETTHGSFWSSPANEHWADASAELVVSAAALGCRRVVVAGTCAEYDWRPDALGDGTCVEAVTPIAPATAYGRAKVDLHQRLRSHPLLEEVSLAWGRVFWLYGDGENPDRLVPGVVRALLSGEEVPLTAGTQVRDFLDARDVGSAFAALLRADVRGAVNVGSGRGVSVAEIATMLGDLTGRAELLRFGAVPARDEPPRVVADVERLRREVGFTPSIPLEDGLRAVVEDWRRRLSA
jgi:UDP-glucose 4-epimerase